MKTNNKLFTNNNIKQFLRAYHKLFESGDESMFDRCIVEYGKLKTANILKHCNFATATGVNGQKVGVFDAVSTKIFKEATKKDCKFCSLYSVYKINQYEQADDQIFLTENSKQIVFDCVVIDKSVNIKKNYGLAEIHQLIERGHIVLLGVKQNKIAGNNFFSKNLIEVDHDYISNFANGFLQKNIFPGIKYLSDQVVMQNARHFDKKFKGLKAARVKIKKEIAKQVVAFELKNDQTELCDSLEKIQNKMVNIANKYKSSASAMQSQICINQNLLMAIDKDFAEPEQDFVL